MGCREAHVDGQNVRNLPPWLVGGSCEDAFGSGSAVRMTLARQAGGRRWGTGGQGVARARLFGGGVDDVERLAVYCLDPFIVDE